MAIRAGTLLTCQDNFFVASRWIRGKSFSTSMQLKDLVDDQDVQFRLDGEDVTRWNSTPAHSSAAIISFWQFGRVKLLELPRARMLSAGHFRIRHFPNNDSTDLSLFNGNTESKFAIASTWETYIPAMPTLFPLLFQQALLFLLFPPITIELPQHPSDSCSGYFERNCHWFLACGILNESCFFHFSEECFCTKKWKLMRRKPFDERRFSRF